MKISAKHLFRFFNQEVSLEELSKRLMQLGHENEVDGDIIDLEITPNRGDCLSLFGISRELKNFYDINSNLEIFESHIEKFEFDFVNQAEDKCERIAFLELEIENLPTEYKPYLESYFTDLDVKKNNFFTDISNYISYELGQPTHCYDSDKLGTKLILEELKDKSSFTTLSNKEITLSPKDLVFSNGTEILNLAGIMGGISSSCSTNTKKVLIECAYFHPPAIIGKSIKYDLNSDAAYKFERGVDPLMLETSLRRFIYIVADHVGIKNLKISNNIYKEHDKKFVTNNKSKIEKIIGIDLDDLSFKKILSNLGFQISEKILVPSFRHDIENLNDIAEELSRVIGYDNLPLKNFTIPFDVGLSRKHEDSIKLFLASEGFYEIINYPFVSNENNSSIKIDNPIDSNKPFMRTSLKQSLLNNLEYNERRQKDSIKFFEVSNLYEGKDQINIKKRLGIVVTGRIGHNFKDFNNFMDSRYLENIIKKISTGSIEIEEIPRTLIDSKNKTKIFYLELDFNDLNKDISNPENDIFINFNSIQYEEISDFPLINRDLSFLIKKQSSLNKLIENIESFEHDLIKQKFIFDLYDDVNSKILKIAYRFVFQSKEKTLKDSEVDKVMSDVVESTLMVNGVEIPGLK